MKRAFRMSQRKDDGDPCIWMQAGIVPRMICKWDYACESCRFDRTMIRIAEENREGLAAESAGRGNRARIMPWKNILRTRPAAQRPCIHSMKHRIDFKTCNHEYFCNTCDFDQYFQDQFMVHAVMSPVSVLDVKGFRVPQGYYFHPGHAWVKVEDSSTVRIGLDEFAQRLFGPLDLVESPLMGKEVVAGRGDTTLIRGSKRARMLSPVNGVVLAINPKLRESGGPVDDDPYVDGWIMNVHATDLRRDLKNLMIHEETRQFMHGEVDKLVGFIEEVAGPLTTDGGHFGKDIFGKVPGLRWHQLAELFLRS